MSFGVNPLSFYILTLGVFGFSSGSTAQVKDDRWNELMPQGVIRKNPNDGTLTDERGFVFPYESYPQTQERFERKMQGLSELARTAIQYGSDSRIYDELMQFSGADFTELKLMLADESWQHYWPLITRSIGMIGSNADIDYLLSYIKEPSIDLSKQEAQTSAVRSLGFAVNRINHQGAAKFLTNHIREEQWLDKTANPRYRSSYVHATLESLAYSGKPFAISLLNGTLQNMNQNDAAGETYDKVSIDKDTLQRYIELAEAIKRKGLSGGMREFNEASTQRLQPGDIVVSP